MLYINITKIAFERERVSRQNRRDDFSRQILTSKVDPRAVRLNIVIMVVDP